MYKISIILNAQQLHSNGVIHFATGIMPTPQEQLVI